MFARALNTLDKANCLGTSSFGRRSFQENEREREYQKKGKENCSLNTFGFSLAAINVQFKTRREASLYLTLLLFEVVTLSVPMS